MTEWHRLRTMLEFEDTRQLLPEDQKGNQFNTMGRPLGSQNKDKPYRDALRIEAALLEKGEESPAPKGSLRWIARQQMMKAGEDTSAAKEVADRLDGKVPQAVIGDDDADPINVVHKIERVIVRPKPANG